MSEWWAEWSSYRPSDFLMFSPRIYWRLFELVNAAWWPAQLLLPALGAGWLGWICLQRRGRSEPRAAAWRAATLVVAAAWAAVAWDFLLQRFAPINWPATGFALAFALQGAGLLVLALAGGMHAQTRALRFRAGIALALWALLGHPLLSVAFARPWQQAEVFGLAPDPTAIATLGLLLLMDADIAQRRWRLWLLRALWTLPLVWCAVSAATLATMGSAQAAVVLAAATLAVAAGLRR